MFQIAQLVGAVCVLVPFMWSQLGRLDTSAFRYLVLKFLESGLLALLALLGTRGLPALGRDLGLGGRLGRVWQATITSASPLARVRTVTPSGSSSKPSGAPASSTRGPGVIPSLRGSGVPEYPVIASESLRGGAERACHAAWPGDTLAVLDRKAATARESAGGDGAAGTGRAAESVVPVLAALDPAARVGPESRAGALRPLLAGGNRALARAVLARKVEQTGTGLLYTYDSSNFDGRYDAEIQRDLITLICKVRFVVDTDSFAAMGYTEAQMEQERREFAASFPSVVSKAWSYKRALKPDWRGTMQCAVRAKAVNSGEHAKITLTFPKAGFRSFINARTTGQTAPTTGTFETDDLKSEKATWGLHTEHEFDFQHIVAAHEFGHMLGIEHIDKAGHTGDAEYGDTWEEANDIMGWGMTVTAHDMKPWIAAGKAYGKEVGMPGGGTWTVVDP